MLETSDRGTLDPRQACAIESASRHSGLMVHLVMTSTHLDLTDNTTCHLYMTTNTKFFTIDIQTAVQDTPLGGITKG